MSEKKERKKLFGKEDRVRVPGPTGIGRPRVNEEKLLLLLRAEQYTNIEIGKACKCDESTVRRYKRDWIADGTLVLSGDKEDFQDTVSLDFDEECQRAMGLSFFDWLKNNTVVYRYLFNRNRRIWKEILGSPSLVRMADQGDRLGAQMCQKFLTAIEGDIKRRRRHKKQFRNLLRFLGRRDLCDRFMTMDDARDPREVKKRPYISLPDFPPKLQKALNELLKIDWVMGLAIMFKLVSNMRTGSKDLRGQEGDDRALMGMRKGSGQSYLLMSEAGFRSETVEKRRAEIRISWIPTTVREMMAKHLETVEDGDYIFQFNIRDLRALWADLTEKHVGVRMVPHDLRSVTITWFYAMDIPLERAVDINSGWADMNTPKRHYIDYDDLMKLSERVAYQKAIPEWFKDGLEEYSRQSQYVELVALLREAGLLNGPSVNGESGGV